MSNTLAHLLADLHKLPGGGREAEQALRKAVIMVAPLLYARTMRGEDSAEIPQRMNDFNAARQRAEQLMPALKEQLPEAASHAVIALKEAMISK